jgi:hypothetical protein
VQQAGLAENLIFCCIIYSFLPLFIVFIVEAASAAEVVVVLKRLKVSTPYSLNLLDVSS